ncbi:MAG: zinc-ribbon domain-containing protein [Candidatus Hermodarchaeota archaeon]
MYCGNCGAELQDLNQIYCPSCGIPLRVKVFKYSGQKNEFKSGIKIPIYELLDSEYILLFVDSKRSKVWIWYGSNTTTRMKFLASTLAPTFRDRYGKGFQIVAVNEGNEPLEFKIMAGLEREPANRDLMQVFKRLDDMQYGQEYERKRMLGNEPSEILKSVRVRRYSEEREDISGFIICDSSGRPIDSNIDIELIEEAAAYITSLIGKARQVLDSLKEGELKAIRLETAKNTEIIVTLEENLILIILKGGSTKRARAKRGDYSDEGDFPFPYIFKPPKPPDDIALAGEPQSKEPETKQVLVYETYCKHCGAELPKGQTICHVCGKKVD